MVAKNHTRDMDCLMKDVEGKVSQLFAQSEARISRLQSEAECARNEFEAQLLEREKSIANIVKTHQEEKDQLRKEFEEKNLEKELREKSLSIENLLKKQAQAKTDMDMYKKATEAEMNKKTLLVQNLRGDVEKHRSDLLNVIQTISRKDAEIESLKTDLDVKLSEKENLEKELSNISETVCRKEAEMRQMATEYQSARTDLETKVTEKELQVQNLQVVLTMFTKHLSFQTFFKSTL